MLSCKQVAHLASDYLDHHTNRKLTFKIRLHLMMCANCRRFVKHLRITSNLARKVAKPNDEINPEDILAEIKIKEREEK